MITRGGAASFLLRYDPPVFTYRMIVEYDGGRYHGWQGQKNARGVTNELLRAFAEVGCEVAELGGSGRTDAGVHALAQCAHLRLRRGREPEVLRRAVNGALAKDVHVLALAEAAPRFHARHDAVLRSYLYQVSRRRTAFAKPFVWWVREALDLGRMGEAAALVPGLHDFVLFCQRPGELEETRSKVETVEIVPAGALVLVRVTASHFLWKMVRRLVGTLVQVGAGALAPEDVAALLAATPLCPGRGTPADWTAPASGLFLERVLYAGDPPLPPPAPVTPVCEEPVLPCVGGSGRSPSGSGKPARRRPAPPRRRG